MKRLMSLETALFGEDKPRYHADSSQDWRPAVDSWAKSSKTGPSPRGRWLLTLSPATLAGLYAIYRRFSPKAGTSHD